MKGIKALLAIIIVLSGLNLIAQDVVVYENLSKKYQKKFSEARKESQKGKADKAIKLYEEVLKKYPMMQEAKLNMAGLYFGSKEYDKSISLFHEALEWTPDTYPLIQFSLAMAYKEKKDFRNAARYLDQYLEIEKTDTKRIKRAEWIAADMHFAADAIENPVPFDPIRLSPQVNTKHSEYTPVMKGDASEVIFTRRIYNQEDFYVSKIDSAGNMTEAQPLEVLNTPGNEGAHSISADGNFMVFTACGRRDGWGLCDLYFSKKEDGEWSRPINMGKRVNSAASDSQPALTADSRGLYFTSDRKGSIGGKDIWYTQRKADGSWYKPVNLGEKINTIYHEESPFIHHDGVTLYFRSTGYPGMGDYDIYRSQWDKDWSTPVNLGYPINTEGSEGALTVSLDGSWAYYASDQHDIGNGERDLDIYKFELPEKIRPKLVSFIRGQVRDGQSKTLIPARVQLKNINTNKVVTQVSTDNKGYYFLTLPLGDDYALVVEKEGYLFFSEHFALDSIYSVIDPYELDIELEPIIEIVENTSTPTKENKPVVLNNIFFETGSATLLPTSDPEIQMLADLLISYPGSTVKILGHTDSVGQDRDNLALSTQRAEAVKQKLIQLEISADRIIAIGLGEQSPIASNDTASGRRQNRRTEFVFKR